jgi:hypothetical protein
MVTKYSKDSKSKMGKMEELEGFLLKALKPFTHRNKGSYIDVTLKQFQNEYYKEVRRNARLTDHSLKDLKRLGHPYAKEGGVKKGSLGHESKWQVHKQDGYLYDAIKKKSIRQSGTSEFISSVGIDQNDVPYIDDIIYGTEKMVARPFFDKTLTDMKKRFNIIAEKNMKKAIKKANKTKVKSKGKK